MNEMNISQYLNFNILQNIKNQIAMFWKTIKTMKGMRRLIQKNILIVSVSQ